MVDAWQQTPQGPAVCVCEGLHRCNEVQQWSIEELEKLSQSAIQSWKTVVNSQSVRQHVSKFKTFLAAARGDRRCRMRAYNKYEKQPIWRVDLVATEITAFQSTICKRPFGVKIDGGCRDRVRQNTASVSEKNK